MVCCRARDETRGLDLEEGEKVRICSLFLFQNIYWKKIVYLKK